HADLVWSGGVIGGEPGSFENKSDGQVLVTGGTELDVPFVNAGELFVATPETVTFDAVLNTGDVDLEMGITVALSYDQTAGHTFDEGATLQVDTVRVLGGTLSGFGWIDGDLDNRGRVDSSEGTLFVNGDYTQSSGGTLALTVGAGEGDTITVPLFV